MIIKWFPRILNQKKIYKLEERHIRSAKLAVGIHAYIAIIPYFFVTITTYLETSSNQESFEMIGHYCFSIIFYARPIQSSKSKIFISEISHKTIIWHYFWRKINTSTCVYKLSYQIETV